MGKQKKSFHTEFASRQHHSQAADRRVAQAIRFASLAAQQNSRLAWWSSSVHFKLAANCYRRAGLGLLAKQQWLSCADCLEKIGSVEAAAECRRKAEAIPTYWEGNQHG
jgi:hypothetical protein